MEALMLIRHQMGTEMIRALTMKMRKTLTVTMTRMTAVKI